MLNFTTLILWLHLIALIIWIGGLFFVALVLISPLRDYSPSPKSFALISQNILRRLQTLAWELVGLIVLTGLFNIIVVGLRRDFQFSEGYFWSLGLKVFLFVVMIVCQVLLFAVFWPRLIKACEDEDTWLPLPHSFAINRRRINGLTLVFLLAGLLAVYLGLGLRQV